MPQIVNKNLNLYNNEKTITKYSRQNYILSPEKKIIEIIKRNKSNNIMLDIGVGTGRTTDQYLGVFKSYIGIDYAHDMIMFCKNKYRDLKNVTFNNQDARNLESINSNSIDFTFFSFNGIDCVNYSDRTKILNEILRVGKRDSYFAFSTHNFYNIPSLFKFQTPKNPFKWVNEFKRLKGVKKHNSYDQIFSKENYAEVIDGDKNNFNYKYIYIKPQYQIKALYKMGFIDIKAFDLLGENININKTDWEKFNDPWIHFICKINK
jgi:ubiquinone/menaquinone biosynthesis C-methylase UbiE